MRAPKSSQGFTLIEVMLATAVMVAVLHVSMIITRASNYTSVKARIDGQVGSLLRYESERTLHMPYSNLVTLASAGGSSSTGFLYKPKISGTYTAVYPYTLTSAMTLNNPNTTNEHVVITTSIQWQEPTPDYSISVPLTKRLSTGTRIRRRF